MTPLLEVADLGVDFGTEDGVVRAVRGVSFTLRAGEVLGVVGESGCGKSVTASAIMGLLPRTATVRGSIRLLGEEMVGRPAEQLRRLRGNRVAMIFQDPMTSLNPVYPVGWQLAEAYRAHHRVAKREATARAVAALDEVGIPDAARRARQYPHEFSGGMRQRAMIAMAVINRPDLIIADEPTTALDVTVQAQILDTLVGITGEAGVAMMLITHDLGVVAGVADRVQVMYGGAVVEAAGVDELFAHPRMPYTVGLLGSVPHPEQVGARLTPIAGAPPSPLHLPPGCAFGPRCPLVQQRCTAAEPDLLPVTVPGGGPGSGHPGTPRTADGAAEHLARCVRWSELPGDRAARTLFEHAEIGSPLNAEPVGREGQR